MTRGAPGSGTEGLVARIFRNTGYLLGGKVMAGILGFASTALAVRALGLGDYGALLLIHACAGSFAAGTRFQSWQPLLHYGNALFAQGERPAFQALLRHCFMLDGLGASIGLALAAPCVIWFGPMLGWPPAYGGMALFYMTSILFMNANCAIGTLRLTDRFRQSAVANVALGLVRLGGALLGLCLHWGIAAFLLVWYAATVASFAVDHILAWRAIRHTPSLDGFRLVGTRWLSTADGIWRLTLSASGNQAVATLATRVGVLLIGAAIGPEAAAIYHVTWQVCDGLSQPANLMTPALYPELIRLRDQKDWPALRRVTRRIFQALGGFSVVALIVAATVGPWLFRTLLAIHRPDSLSLLLLLTAAAILDLWDIPLEPLLTSLGRAQQLFVGRVAVTLLSLPLLYGLARFQGVEGAGLATLLAEGLVLTTRLVPYFRLGRT
ncbi:lipopolysaccharide biosynthesis protein [Gluconacetobacter azotocaptans]|uniref:Lipopolysaccharide biosynthesis protein n=1 Tax=Gluconacetobacter azotocaptans TaxID=142834 RepID=A0A7W4JRR4_9PROT|nr:lipopolysaccharide biosynthesis protein [Gluconacetobacter azotocaptans]MBB2189607.1 lipopolysaccharide biosynthesis protein [Gluconacetobacter azotocaptans]MBM9403107.1 lipopolysaccharide biosynthesis protein [Gluconacetobacter azotocaptans]GBQ36249.1 hypothetical protein AA13594_3250 [Gluconacetobacter azotocaptans DSM 13594]